MQTLRAFFKIVDFQTILVTGLAVLSTFLSRRFNFVAELPIDLIGLAVVFPLVFSINSAYRMREDALQAFAALKGSAVGLYYAHRDWANRGETPAARAIEQIEELMHALADELRTGSKGDLKHVFEIFSNISRSIEKLRANGVADIEIATANQFLRDMVVNFERMNNVARYRTPISLRAFTRIFLNVLPILFGPHFANIDYPDYPFIGYLVAGLYAFVLVSLDNVQDHLENPFDGIGEDDLRLNLVDEVVEVLGPAG